MTTRTTGTTTDATVIGRGGRRYEPDRRRRILEVTLEVIAEQGVAGTTHRRVAAAADVPLGAMTYYFSGLSDLLASAFTLLAERWADAFDAAMAAVPPGATADHVAAAVADAVLADLTSSTSSTGSSLGGLSRGQRQALLTCELYAFAAREPAVRAVTQAWMERTRASLERHLDPETARLVDALIEGLTLHAVLSTQPVDAARLRADVARLLATAGTS